MHAPQTLSGRQFAQAVIHPPNLLLVLKDLVVCIDGHSTLTTQENSLSSFKHILNHQNYRFYGVLEGGIQLSSCLLEVLIINLKLVLMNSWYY